MSIIDFVGSQCRKKAADKKAARERLRNLAERLAGGMLCTD